MPLSLFVNGRFLCQRQTGVQRVSREFVMALDGLLEDGASDAQVRLIAPAGADFTSLSLRHVETEHLAGGHGYYWEQVALARRVGRGSLLCLGNTAPLFSMTVGRRVSVMLHDQSYRLFAKDYGRAYRAVHAIMDHRILRRGRPLFTVSESEKANILEAHPTIRPQLIVAPNGSWSRDRAVEVDDYAARIEPGLGLYVGGVADRKNIDGVFAAAAAMARRGYPFVFVGRPTARSEAFFATLPGEVRSKMRFTDFVSNDELESLYRRAAYLLYPSFYEASGLPPSEAMTFGCPVIVSDLPVMRERCGDASLYCDPHDHRTIIAAAARIVDDPGLASELSRRGRERVRRFSWRNQALIIIRALEAG